MRRITKDGFRNYLIAALSVVAATQARVWLDPWVGDHIPFGTYLVAVVATAWLAGSGPACFALMCGLLAAAHYIVPPENSLLIQDTHVLVSLCIYGLVGFTTIVLFELNTQKYCQVKEQLRKIHKLSADLKLSDKSKDQFLALLAHELRNPLAPIRSGLAILQSPDLPDQSRKEVLRTLRKQLEQLVRIVDDLLDVTRFVHGQIILECHPLDLRDVIENAIQQGEPDIKDRQQDLQLLMPAFIVPVDGDNIRIIQIVTNLLTNASKYTPRQGRIQVMLEVSGDEAILTVTDNGIGITRDMQQQIFQMFSRSAAAISRDHGGLGLGLPIARQFAEMHRGTLRAFSEGADMGSRFELRLPLIAEDDYLEYVKSNEPQRSSVEFGQFPQDVLKTRIMIVDDNVDAAETMAMLLALDGYETTCLFDGFQALKKVHDFRPDIVLLDIGLPGMDGYEVARRLREEFILQPLTLIAVTGWGGDEDVRKSELAGIDHHLVKPVNPEELTRLMKATVPHA